MAFKKAKGKGEWWADPTAPLGAWEHLPAELLQHAALGCIHLG